MTTENTETPDIEAAKTRLREAAELLEKDWKANAEARIGYAYKALGGDTDDLYEGGEA